MDSPIILCLGAGTDPTMPQGVGRISADRVDAAAGLLAARPDALLVFSGGNGEAAAMKAYAMAKYDIAESRILCEEDSRNTAENVHNISRMLRQDKTIILVAGRNARRAAAYLRAYGFTVQTHHVPVDSISWRDRCIDAGLRVLQLVDRRGRLASALDRRRRR